MTTGYTSSGGASHIGDFDVKSWYGEDSPPREKTQKPPMPPPLDFDGRELGPHATKEELRRGRIRAKMARLRRGSLPARSFTGDHNYSCYWRKGYNAKMKMKYFGYEYPFMELFGEPSPPEGGFDANDDLALINKLRSKVLGSDFNAGIALAESGEALAMIADSATRVARAIRSVRRGNIKGALRALNITQRHARSDDPKRVGSRTRDARLNASSAWLELQYGWRPLLSDMRDGAEFLAHQMHSQKPERIRVSRKVDLGPPSSSAPTQYLMVGYGYTRKTIIAKVWNADIPTLSIANPQGIAWELVPFSFVVDWALPIGEYLQALDTAASMTGTFVTTTVTRFKGRSDRDNIEFWWDGASDFSYEGGSMSRVVSTSLDVPLPTVKPLGKVLSPGHAINALALLAQAFK